MANNNTEKIGVDTVVEGLDRFVKDFKTYADTVKKGGDETEKFQKKTEKTKKSSGIFNGAMKSMRQGLQTFTAGLAHSVPIVGGFASAITTALGPIGLAITAVIGLAAGIAKLGQRGGEVKGIRTAFANIIAPVLEADESIQGFVDNLREAAGGTVAEIDLLTQANIALAGSSGEVRDTFARALPDLLEVARVQAAATGQSVDFLFQSLVTGIKRSSPLLIDNTGLVLNITEANEAYAESIGVSVSALTDQQKQIALIDATVSAGAEAIAAAGGIQVNAASEASKAQALLKDTVDSLALAFEPLGAVILQGVNALLTFVNTIVREAAPFIQFFGQSLANVFNGASAVMNVFSGQARQTGKDTTEAVGEMAKGTVAPMQFFVDTIGGAFSFIVDLGQDFVRGAVSLVAAYGNAWLAGANRFVFPVIIQIAQFIADFLTGFSPAKEGPLSEIDTGASNLMKAWSDGFVDGFEPQKIEDVTSQVDAILGDIGAQSLETVNARLKRLDTELRPFNEQLKIVKDRFEAIQAPAQAAIASIDRQLQKATEALIAGEEGAAEAVRKLNIQKEALSGQLDLEQQRIDQATVQLALAKSGQQEERTSLEIQKARLKGTEAQVKAIEKVAKAQKVASKAVKAPKAGKAGEAPKAGGAPTAEGLPDRVGEIGEFAAGEQIENPFAGLLEFGAELGEDFLSGLGAGGELDAFQENLSLLGAATDEIANSDPVQGLLGAFEGFGDGLADVALEAVEGFVNFFTDPNTEGSIAQFITRVNTEGFASVFGDITGGITSWARDTIVPVFRDAVDLIMSAFISPSDPDSLYSRFQRASSDFSEFVGDIAGALSQTIATWVATNILAPIGETLAPYFDIASEDGIFSAFVTLGTDIQDAAGDMLAPINAIFDPIKQWVLGTAEGGGLPQMISEIVSAFEGVPMAIFNAMQNIGAVFASVLITPVQGVIDLAVEILQGFLNTITDNEVVNWFKTNFPNVFGGLPDTFILQAPQIPTPSFSATFPTGQASGGITQGPGMVRLGEAGEELAMLTTGASLATFNNQFVKSMDALSGAIGGGGMNVASPTNTTNNSSNTSNSLTLNNNVQGGANPADILNQIALAKVFN